MKVKRLGYARLRVTVTTTVFCLGMPSIFVILATAGESSNGVFTGFIGRPGIYIDFWSPVELAAFSEFQRWWCSYRSACARRVGPGGTAHLCLDG